MRGLMLKEWYTARANLLLYAGLSLLFWSIGLFRSGTSLGFFLFYPGLFIGLVSYSGLLQEESDHWSDYAGTLPCSRRMRVTAKYRFSLLVSLASGAVLLAMAAFRWQLKPEGLSVWACLSTHLVICLLNPAINLPILYRFSVRVSRWLTPVVIGAGAALTAMLSISGVLERTSPFLLPPSLLLYLLSWRLSIRFFEGRDR